MKTKKYQLKNGLKVILTESHKAPVVSVQMWVRTGSADEKKGEEGISHFIEHLVFKGTDKFKVGEIASQIEGAGGELNAYTSFDQTVFYVTLSNQFSDLGLLAISEMMGFPTFDSSEIDNEREVVIEEIKRGRDSLGRKASELLFKNNYRKHPYGIPVIGYEENIRKMSSQKIKKYYHSRYVPQNMFLVVSGNFEMKEMQKRVQRYFGQFKKYHLKKITRKAEPAQKKAQVMIEKSEFNQSICYLSWKAPSIKHKDIPALDVLSIILGQGDSSRLVKKLRIDSAIVNSVGASAYTPIDDGLFTISFGYNKENLKAALTGISEVLGEFFISEITTEEVRKAVLNLECEEYFSVETVDGLSRKMGSLEFYFKNLNAQNEYIKKLRKLKTVDIFNVANKYLNEKSFSVSLVSNDEVKTVESILNPWLKEFLQLLKSKKSYKIKKSGKVPHEKIDLITKKSGQSQIKSITLKNGVRVLLRHSTETHLISAKIAMIGGIREEGDLPLGSTELMGKTWTCGTKERSENQISQEIESIAAGISPVVGKNSIGLGLDVLTSFEQQGSNLFFDILTNPTFSSDILEREKLIQLEQIKNRNDNPAQKCVRLFNENIFKGHPYSRDILGTETSLREITQDSVRRSWQQSMQRKNMVFSLSGHFNEKHWIESLEAYLTGFTVGENLLKKQNFNFKLEDKVVFEESKKEQSHLIFGFHGLSLTDKDRFTLQIIQSVLAGQGGRLFLELRDKNSLAYSVSPMQMEGIECGYFGAYIGCSPEKVTKALSMMKEQFSLLCETQISNEELLRAQRYLVGRHDIDLQRTSAISSAILYNSIYGLDPNEAINSANRYFAVTKDDVLNLSQKLFTGKSLTALVGPENCLKA